jgi:hypothetical protein
MIFLRHLRQRKTNQLADSHADERPDGESGGGSGRYGGDGSSYRAHRAASHGGSSRARTITHPLVDSESDRLRGIEAGLKRQLDGLP